jgi:hypothetical protein
MATEKKKTEQEVLLVPLDQQDYKVARALLKASEFGREAKWKDFLVYCEHAGVDGKELCQWTHDLLDLEYNQSFKDRVEILRIRDRIVHSWKQTQMALEAMLALTGLKSSSSSDSNDGGKP